ncbi:Protein YIPF [Meloidogyne graminicola]|uniref:Protein YIPF n=1 Tax=Meloidogyne graminicola TaxID=189291 RepID=A0A8S9ZVQ7_9BILA|nr:Protein YIPF [Meloidogyne graminicola]
MTDPYGGYFYENEKNSPTNSNWYTSPQPPPPQNVGQPVNVVGWESSNQNEPWRGSPSPPNSYPYPNYSNQGQQIPNMFIPSIPTGQASFTAEENFDNEPPLLEELGINFEHIRLKTLAVLNPLGTAKEEVIEDQDLAGPLVFCLLFGASLLLHGKIKVISPIFKLHFGHIYGIGLVGCTGMYALLNLMAQEDRSITFTNTASVLGYCLLPMSLLSLLAAVLSLQGLIGYIFVTLAILWSGSSSSKLFSIALSLNGQRLLIAYPCILLYSVFALLAIF